MLLAKGPPGASVLEMVFPVFPAPALCQVVDVVELELETPQAPEAALQVGEE